MTHNNIPLIFNVRPPPYMVYTVIWTKIETFRCTTTNSEAMVAFWTLKGWSIIRNGKGIICKRFKIQTWRRIQGRYSSETRYVNPGENQGKVTYRENETLIKSPSQGSEFETCERFTFFGHGQCDFDRLLFIVTKSRVKKLGSPCKTKLYR